MKTALLLTNTPDSQRYFESLLGAQLNLIPVSTPTEPSREKFDALLHTWLRLADLVIVDGTSLDANTRWAVEALASLETPPVIFRVTPAQRQSLAFPRAWHVLLSTDSEEQAGQSAITFLDLCRAKQRLSAPARPTAPAPVTLPAAPFDAYRYRDALKTLSGLLGQQLGERELVSDFLRLVRELVGVAKLAIFTRRLDAGLFAGQETMPATQLSVAASSGIEIGRAHV